MVDMMNYRTSSTPVWVCVSFSPRDRANLALTGDLHVPSWWGNYIASPRLIEVSVTTIARTQSLSPHIQSVNPPQANYPLSHKVAM